MTIDTEHLKSLLERVTPGEWASRPQEGVPGYCFCAQVFVEDGDLVATMDPTESDQEANSNAELMSLAPTNARRVIAAEKLAEALAGMLNHSGVADAHPEDKDGIDHEYESHARAAIQEWRSL